MDNRTTATVRRKRGLYNLGEVAAMLEMDWQALRWLIHSEKLPIFPKHSFGKSKRKYFTEEDIEELRRLTS